MKRSYMWLEICCIGRKWTRCGGVCHDGGLSSQDFIVRSAEWIKIASMEKIFFLNFLNY